MRLKDVNWLWFALILTGLYTSGVVYVIGWADICTFFTDSDTQLNAIGDFLAGTFAPVAVFWLVAGVMTQRQELGDARKQFAENQEVIDKQLNTIDSQNKLLSLQHEQAVENAKKAYRLTLFDKRFQMYEKFIAFGDQYTANDFDYDAYFAMVNLSQEARFLFDYEVEDWLREISDQIFQYIEFRDANPLADVVIGEFDHERNLELGKKFKSYTDWIREQFLPIERADRFWRFMHVSDEPYREPETKNPALS